MGYRDPAFWFSAKGRIDRRQFMFASLVSALVPQLFTLAFEGTPAVYAPVLLLATYSGIILTIKRAHDRGRSGWFLLLILVPALNLWPVIELGACRGEEGENRYGPPPEGAPAAAQPSAQAA